MKADDRARALRAARLAQGFDPVPASLQGVTLSRLTEVLTTLNFGTRDMIEVLYALIDDQTASWFSRGEGLKFSDGATTAHLACHVGILQRGEGRLDREGRDYWIKPMRELGIVEPVYFVAKSREMLSGHLIPKSSNCGYRVNPEFLHVIRGADWSARLEAWVDEDRVRARQRALGEAAERARQRVDSSHGRLIEECLAQFVPAFLSGYTVLFVDDADGERISYEERQDMERVGISLELGDSVPDILLWNPVLKALWVVEAVTSDGEVDLHKVNRVTALANRSGITQVGFTTAYWTWPAAAARQARVANLAVGSYLWIAQDPAKHWRAEGWPTDDS